MFFGGKIFFSFEYHLKKIMKKLIVLNSTAIPDQFNLIGRQLSSSSLTFSQETIFCVGKTTRGYLYLHLMNDPYLETIQYYENQLVLGPDNRQSNSLLGLYEVWNATDRTIDLAYLRRSSTPPSDNPPSGGEPPGYHFIYYPIRSNSISGQC
jgi:hypothetical protein